MPLRVVLLGTPEFAVPSFAAIVASSHHVVAVVTQPDRARGRGLSVTPGPVKAAAQAASVPVLQPDHLKEDRWLETFGNLAPDLAVVVAYGRLMPQAMLDIPRLGVINVHASLLPRWRGAAPVHRAILAGDRETGITIMRVVLALDAGPMIDRVATPIDSNETSEALETRLADLGAGLLIPAIDRIASGTTVNETPQDDSHATYAARLQRSDSPIDWDRPAPVIHNQIRGLHPWPLASTTFAGRRVLLRRSVVEHDRPTELASGTILAAHDDDLIVSARPGAVRILELQPEGRRTMPVRDFLNGTRLVAGNRLT